MIRYTPAPLNYDYPDTVISSTVLLGRRQDIWCAYRRVELVDDEGGYYADYQIRRYQSGAYPVFTQAEYDDLAHAGLL